MKTKTFIIFAVVAIVTLSFTFATNKNVEKTNISSAANEPIGGLASEDTF